MPPHFAQYDIYAKICLIQITAKVYAVNTKFYVDILQWVFRQDSNTYSHTISVIYASVISIITKAVTKQGRRMV